VTNYLSVVRPISSRQIDGMEDFYFYRRRRDEQHEPSSFILHSSEAAAVAAGRHSLW
jgi:hypothetical protein